MAILLVVAFFAALRHRCWSRPDTLFAPLWASAALAAWALIRAALAHDVSAAVPTIAVLAAVVAVVTVSRRTSDVVGLTSAVLAVGALVALTGWVGVAWRLDPWALEDQGLWRAATSLTYANATAGLLALLAVLALGRLVERPGSPLAATATSILLLGVGATLSRGGLLATGAGLVTLGALLGLRRVARALVAPAIGAAIALAGLVPSMPADSPASPVVATFALAAGVTAAAGLAVLSVQRPRRAMLGVLAVTVLVALAGASTAQDITAVGDRRFTLSSPDRAEALKAGIRLVAKHPLAGVGPGQAELSWIDPGGRTLVAKYAHNEYLQVLSELGIVGLALLLAVFATVAREVRKGRSGASSPQLWAGGVGGLVALGAGSAFDFLWHVPAVPLFAALVIGITVPRTVPRTKEQP